MKVSAREVIGLLIGAATGAAPFLWVWFVYGRGARGFDESAMWGIPAIMLAPLGGLGGAILGVAVADPKV